MKNGDRLKIARLAAGLSQAALAADVGVTDACINRIEKGRNGASMDLWRRLATRLRVPFSLLTDADAPDPARPATPDPLPAAAGDARG